MSKSYDWDALKRHHRFVRDGDTQVDVSREEKLARDYESQLFKEFALVDLKHFKTKRLALRWRTATEVVQGLGEETCGSLRCHYHTPPRDTDMVAPRLQTFDLPFAYEEGGRKKETMVKVRLCAKCSKKLTWKPQVDRGSRRRSSSPSRLQSAQRCDRAGESQRRRSQGKHLNQGRTN